MYEEATRVRRIGGATLPLVAAVLLFAAALALVSQGSGPPASRGQVLASLSAAGVGPDELASVCATPLTTAQLARIADEISVNVTEVVQLDRDLATNLEEQREMLRKARADPEEYSAEIDRLMVLRSEADTLRSRSDVLLGSIRTTVLAEVGGISDVTSAVCGPYDCRMTARLPAPWRAAPRSSAEAVELRSALVGIERAVGRGGVATAADSATQAMYLGRPGVSAAVARFNANLVHNRAAFSVFGSLQ